MKKIVIQGIGYVGLAMLTFCAGATANGFRRETKAAGEAATKKWGTI